MNNKTIKLTIQNLKAIHELCKELGIEHTKYDCIEDDLAGKLIFDLSRIKIFHVNDLKAGRIIPPVPADYQRGGKYDR